MGGSMTTIMAGILVVYSVIKTLYIVRSRNEFKILTYDTSYLSEKDRKEFNNFITNLLSNLTFFYGTLIYVLGIYTEVGVYIGIALMILVVVSVVILIKVKVTNFNSFQVKIRFKNHRLVMPSAASRR